MSKRQSDMFEETITNEYLGLSKTLRARSWEDLNSKVRQQRQTWARTEALEREKKSLERMQVEAARKSEEAKEDLEKVRNVLTLSLNQDYKLQWPSLIKEISFPTFERWCQERNAVLPTIPVLEDYYLRFSVPRPVFLEDWVPYLKTRRLGLESKARSAFDLDMVRHVEELDSVKQLYSSERESARRKQTTINENMAKLKDEYELGSVDGIKDYLRKVLTDTPCACRHNHNTTIHVGDDASTVVIGCWLPSLEQLPNIQEFRLVKAKKSITPVRLPDKQLRALFEETGYQHVLRYFLMVFQCDYKAWVKSAVFNGWVSSVSPATGTSQMHALSHAWLIETSS